jgi:parvulin-like peptidyl-prolyl isomerase
VPAAAIVEGQIITLTEYEAELARFEAGQSVLGIELATWDDYQGQVLQVLIDRALLAQAAIESGMPIDDEENSSRLEGIIQELGGQEEFDAWLNENGYSFDSFREALLMDALADQMADQLADGVESTAEQVHARHILLSTREEAEEARSEVLAGASFEDIAWARSLDPSTRLAGGDLGWFPRQFLLVEEVEQVAFSLEIGEISPVFESEFGFHFVEVLDRAVRPLSPAALQEARHRAVNAWLTERRETANIEIRVEP